LRDGSRCLLIVLLAGNLFAQPAPLPPRALGGARCEQTAGYDVLIVGAGLAGLSAARELIHLGHSVLILEANQRIGGRAWVAQIPVGEDGTNVPIDYGGAWIHGVPTNPLTSLVDALKFQRARSELEVPFYIDGKRASHDQQERFKEAVEEYESELGLAAAAEQQEHALSKSACASAKRIEARTMAPRDLCGQLNRMMADKSVARRLCSIAGRIGKNFPAKSFCAQSEIAIRSTSDVAAAYLPRDPRFRDVLPLLIANAGPLETAAELKESSAVDASQFAAGEDDLVDKGLGAFVQKFGEDLPVCVNSTVTNVGYSGSGVTLRAAGRTYQAATALVTVSAGVLAAKRIAFDPPLPAEKIDAIEHLRMGNMQKVIIPFTRDIFRDELPNSWVLYEGDLPTRDEPRRRVMAFVIKPLGASMAIGFFGGDWARALESGCKGKESGSGPRSQSGCDDLSIQIATAALSKMYGEKEVLGTIQSAGVHVTRWSLDETSLGAYSVPVPGNWEKHEVLRHPIGVDMKDDGPKQVFFAGEGTARAIYNGSYPGAYESGLEAARAIHASLLEVRRGH
jgi:monoamine oxidase